MTIATYVVISTGRDPSRKLEHSPLRPVSQRKNELQEHESKVRVFQDRVDNRGGFVAERKGVPDFPFLWVKLCGADQVHDDASGQPESRWCSVSV